MDRVNLSAPDPEFIREVEKESGQTVSHCYQCGNCTAGCPMSFAYDFTVSRMMRLIQAGQRETVLSSRSLWMCATCEACSQRCPNNIDVAKVMDVCRHIARRAGKKGVYSVKTFQDSFLTSIKWNGRVHEIGLMAMYMLRTGRLWTDVDLAPRALPKNKMSILPHRTEGKKEVAEIIERFNKSKEKEMYEKAQPSEQNQNGGGS